MELVGLNLFRTRYNGIKHAKSLLEFESDVLLLKLNGGDVGDINHSRKFAKTIDEALYKTMKTCLSEQLNEKLPSTGECRPVGFVMDKMTPNKRTGQVHGIITPIPENDLTENFLVPIMLDLPVCKDLTANGLANIAKCTLKEFGISDSQVQRFGWDGEYIKKDLKRLWFLS